MEWRERFDKEMMEKSKATSKGATVQSGSKLTGRSLFHHPLKLSLKCVYYYNLT